MEQNQNGWEEIAQIIEEHIDFMTRRYGETDAVCRNDDELTLCLAKEL